MYANLTMMKMMKKMAMNSNRWMKHTKFDTQSEKEIPELCSAPNLKLSDTFVITKKLTPKTTIENN